MPARIRSLCTVGSLAPVGPGFRRGDTCLRPLACVCAPPPHVIPANAGTHCSNAHNRRQSEWRGRASKASNAPNRKRQAGKQSEAAPQATREAGSAGRPGVAPWGQEAPADWGALFNCDGREFRREILGSLGDLDGNFSSDVFVLPRDFAFGLGHDGRGAGVDLDADAHVERQ